MHPVVTILIGFVVMAMISKVARKVLKIAAMIGVGIFLINFLGL